MVLFQVKIPQVLFTFCWCQTPISHHLPILFSGHYFPTLSSLSSRQTFEQFNWVKQMPTKFISVQKYQNFISVEVLKILACKPAYGRHMLGCQPSAGTWGPTGPTKALWAYPQNFVMAKHKNTHTLRLLYIDLWLFCGQYNII